MKYVEELLLTPGTRVYKTACFFEKDAYDKNTANLNDKWAVMVSDYQIGQADGKAAAQYFYSDFLGCGYPNTSARTTKHFYECVCSFIKDLDTPEEKKSDYINALNTYLKVDTSSAISSSDFASKYFDDIMMQDVFTEYMEKSGVPSSSFTKDIEHIKSKLKFRRINFKRNVKIVAPVDVFEDLVTIETIEGDPDEAGNPSEWTKVIIKDRIYQQE